MEPVYVCPVRLAVVGNVAIALSDFIQVKVADMFAVVDVVTVLKSLAETGLGEEIGPQSKMAERVSHHQVLVNVARRVTRMVIIIPESNKEAKFAIVADAEAPRGVFVQGHGEKWQPEHRLFPDVKNDIFCKYPVPRHDGEFSGVEPEMRYWEIAGREG